MKRLTTLLLIALLTLAACAPADEPDFSSTSSEPSSSGISSEPVRTAVPFTLAIYPEFSLHPTQAANRANLTLSPLLYEGLFTLDSAFQPQPVLCQSYTASEDKLVWTFTLRSGITFSDGTPLTGQTVADALELARSAGRYQSRLADVTAVIASGEAANQVTITLSRPNGALPALLDIPIALGSGERPAGTGPYVLAGTEDALSLTARSGWWQRNKTLPIQTIPLHNVGKSDELIYAFDAGKVSLVDVDLMATNSMGYGGNYQTWDYATTDFLYLGFNLQRGACRSVQARQALARAVDRESIASVVYANHAVSTLLPVHPSSPLYSQTVAAAAPGYDLEGLAEQMESLRLTGQTLTLVVNNENVSKTSAAQRIAYQLEAAGLTVELRQLSFEDYTAVLSAGSFDLYLGETVFTADFDLAPLLSSTGALNYSGWRDGSADALLSALHAAAPEDKPAAAEALFARLNDQIPIVPIAFKNGSVLTQWGRLSGLSPVRSNVFYQLENWTIIE